MVDYHLNNPIPVQESFDLGWLILNGNIGDEELCQFLLVETSQEIERLVIHFLKSPADQLAAVDRIIFNLLLRRRSYKSNVSGRAWLYALILEECQKRLPNIRSLRGNSSLRLAKAVNPLPDGESHFSSYIHALSDMQRLYVILHYGQNLATDEIAYLLKKEVTAVHTNLEQAQANLIEHWRTCEECSDVHSNMKSVEKALSETLQAKSPLLETARENKSDWRDSLLIRLQREKQRQRSHKWTFRAAEFVFALFVLVAALWSFAQLGSNLSPDKEPTGTVLPQVAVVLHTPPPSPTRTPLPPAALVGANKSLSDILSFSLTSWARWKTLWADVQVLSYQVEDFSDGRATIPDQIYRKQIWLSPPGSSRVISGPFYGNPDTTYSIANNYITGLNYVTGSTIEYPSNDLILDVDLRKLFSPIDVFPSGGEFTFIGIGQVAGRPTWVVEWWTNGHKVYRYWIDQEYGVVMRRIEYAESIFFPVISDITVKKIFFDGNFSPEIFAPFQYKSEYFVKDFSGDPEIIDFKSALKDWSTPNIRLANSSDAPFTSGDYSSSHLFFSSIPAGWTQTSYGPGVELYADQKDLGRLPLGGSSILSCERSSDGSRIFYNSPPKAGSGDTSLYVADLASIQTARPALLNGITSGDFALSPDDRRLAFFGCVKASGFCGILILDLESWQLTQLAPMTYADYIMWKPDGRSIALVGKDDLTKAYKIIETQNVLGNEFIALTHAWHFEIINADNGDITYKREFNWSNLEAPPDSPTRSWPSSFKVPNAGVKQCINPPAKTVKN